MILLIEAYPRLEYRTHSLFKIKRLRIQLDKLKKLLKMRTPNNKFQEILALQISKLFSQKNFKSHQNTKKQIQPKQTRRKKFHLWIYRQQVLERCQRKILAGFKLSSRKKWKQKINILFVSKDRTSIRCKRSRHEKHIPLQKQRPLMPGESEGTKVHISMHQVSSMRSKTSRANSRRDQLWMYLRALVRNHLRAQLVLANWIVYSIKLWTQCMKVAILVITWLKIMKITTQTQLYQKHRASAVSN